MALELGTLRRVEARGFEGLAIIDCDVHNEVIAEIPAHLAPRWRGYLEQIGLRTWPLESPRGSRCVPSPRESMRQRLAAARARNGAGGK